MTLLLKETFSNSWAKNKLNIEFFKLNSTFKASDATISAKIQE